MQNYPNTSVCPAIFTPISEAAALPARVYGFSEDFAPADLQTCVDLCRRTHDACVRITVFAGSWRGQTARLQYDQLRLLADCAQICETAADFITRNSPYHFYFCFLCGAICEACAEACELGPISTECAQLCRLCAASCRMIAD